MKFMNILDYITDYRFKIFNTHWWKDLYYSQISSRLFPRQRWLTKKLPRTWTDKDHVMEICVLECIKHYVEGEDALKCYKETQADPTFPEWQKEWDRQVKENYNLITKTLPDLQKKLEKEWDKIPNLGWEDINKSNVSFKKRYGKINKLEAEIYELQTKIMTWAITNRDKMWT